LKLADRLGTLPSGKIQPLSPDTVGRWLREKYLTDTSEMRRRKDVQLRLDFYDDRSASQIEADIEMLFKNARVREWRKELIPFAEFQNLTRRVVNEISTVYSEPATRAIKGKQATEQYKELQRLIRMDRRMRRVNRLVNLCNDVLIYFHVRPDDRDTPVLQVVTPDQFYAVSHPNDPAWPVAYILCQTPRALYVKDSDPHYLVLTEAEHFKLDKNGLIITETYSEHEMGRIPAVLAQREEREDAILDASSGRDLISAHRAIALLNVLMLKHQKSGTKMAVATGDTSDMAREQPLDEEGLLEAPDGVSLSTLDMGSDPANYITAARAVIKQIAANRGIPESVFDLSYQATSGFEIELKRVGLREVRRDQMLDFRPIERNLADLQSLVLRSTSHKYAFDVDGWSIDFGEVETPQEPITKLQYWEKLEKLGLISREDMWLSLNPEGTRKEAKVDIEFNIDVAIERMRKWQSASISQFGPKESANPPTDKDGERQDVVREERERVAR